MGRTGHRMILESGLPEDAVTGGARVTLMARTSVLIEGQRGVIELSTARIRLKTDKGILSVLGSGLRLAELSLDAAMITGDAVTTVTYGRADG